MLSWRGVHQCRVLPLVLLRLLVLGLLVLGNLSLVMPGSPIPGPLMLGCRCSG